MDLERDHAAGEGVLVAACGGVGEGRDEGCAFGFVEGEEGLEGEEGVEGGAGGQVDVGGWGEGEGHGGEECGEVGFAGGRGHGCGWCVGGVRWCSGFEMFGGWMGGWC